MSEALILAYSSFSDDSESADARLDGQIFPKMNVEVLQMITLRTWQTLSSDCGLFIGSVVCGNNV
mgnify:FL=1